MSDLLPRLNRALPSVIAWMSELLNNYSGSAAAIDSQRFSRLAHYLSPHVLSVARVVLVPRPPFPPVAQYGVPEFWAMESLPMAGITFGHTFFLAETHASDEGVYFHELIHTIQWRVLGVRDFLLTYAIGLAQHGYENSPLESIAYSLQGAFDRREWLNGVEEIVALHATETRNNAQAVFAAYSVPWGA